MEISRRSYRWSSRCRERYNSKFFADTKKASRVCIVTFFLLGELKKIWRSPKILTFWRFEKETFFSETETYFDLVKNRKLSKFK